MIFEIKVLIINIKIHFTVWMYSCLFQLSSYRWISLLRFARSFLFLPPNCSTQQKCPEKPSRIIHYVLHRSIAKANNSRGQKDPKWWCFMLSFFGGLILFLAHSPHSRAKVGVPTALDGNLTAPALNAWQDTRSLQSLCRFGEGDTRPSGASQSN